MGFTEAQAFAALQMTNQQVVSQNQLYQFRFDVL
jgi:hypothetical protein